MKLCPNCGIELDEHLSECPLCNFSRFDQPVSSGEGRDLPADPRSVKLLFDYQKLTREQKRKLFWELSGIVLFSGVIVTLIIDLVTSGSITWSSYTITICLVLFANSTLFSFWRHRIFIMLGGSFIATSILLLLLDLYGNKAGWGVQLGIPLLLSLYLMVSFLTLIIRYSKQHGFNLLGFFFLSFGVLAISIEAILSRYVAHRITLQWSLIVMACMIPISAILFFIHYRLNRGIELRRFFHI